MNQLLDELKTYIEPQKAAYFPQFFKAFPGGYGEGDLFWGIRIPPLRLLAKKYRSLSLDELRPLITSKIHEQRMLALFILRLKFEKAPAEKQQLIITFYLKYLHSLR
ncbi:DNA alkylation repair protein [Psychromonas aquimarina]|uniref:DNA alkylation repair protein n=1 Tax=Psychromonas aquimarina TaxID=444919 RepID=UPI00041D7E6D|nr:DNA alkylation repair protein [Psychromonas aquimarina]